MDTGYPIIQRPFYSWPAEAPDTLAELTEAMKQLTEQESKLTEVKTLQAVRQRLEMTGKRYHVLRFLTIFTLSFIVMFVIAQLFIGDLVSTILTLKKTEKVLIEVDDILLPMKIERRACLTYRDIGNDWAESKLTEAVFDTRKHLAEAIWAPRMIAETHEAGVTIKCSNVPLEEIVEIYSDWVRKLVAHFCKALPLTKDIFFWKMLVKYKRAIYLADLIETEMVLRSSFDHDRGFHAQKYFKFYHRAVNLIASSTKQYGENRNEIWGRFQVNNTIIMGMKSTKGVFNSSWSDFVTAIQSEETKTLPLKRKSLFDIVQGKLTIAWSSLLICIVSSIISLLLSCLTVYRIRRISKFFEKYLQAVSARMDELSSQRERAESVLCQVVPRPIVKTLDRTELKAEYFPEVTILFADIHGVSFLISKYPPTEVVYIMNCLFTVMDERIEKYNAYRMDIAGESYMVTSGVPCRNGKKHVSEIANLSLDLLNVFSDIEVIYSPESRVSVQLGIHTGPCVAALFGGNKPRYRVIGETVGITSRMEITSLPNKIQLSSTSQALLDPDDYIIRPRGFVQIEGKRKIFTYWLIGRAFHKDEEVSKAETYEFDRSRRRESFSAWSSVGGSYPNSETNGSRISMRMSVSKISTDERSSNILRQFRRVTQEIPSQETIERLYESRKGSPLILQLTEGVHY